MEDVLNIDGVEGVERVWSVATANSGSSRLLCSTAAESFMLQIEPQVEVLPLADAVASRPLVAAGVIGGKVVTVSKSGVHVWDDVSSGVQSAESTSGNRGEIVAAAIHGYHVAVAHRGGSVSVMKAENGGLREVSR
jgi:hypothetical protein